MNRSSNSRSPTSRACCWTISAKLNAGTGVDAAPRVLGASVPFRTIVLGRFPHVFSILDCITPCMTVETDQTRSGPGLQQNHALRLKWCPGPESNQRHADFQSTADRLKSGTCAKSSVKPQAGNQRLSGDLSNLPVGGTTGLCHQSTAGIDEAAQWYAVNRDTCPRPVTRELRQRFGLSTHDAVMAISQAVGRCR